MNRAGPGATVQRRVGRDPLDTFAGRSNASIGLSRSTIALAQYGHPTVRHSVPLGGIALEVTRTLAPESDSHEIGYTTSGRTLLPAATASDTRVDIRAGSSNGLGGQRRIFLQDATLMVRASIDNRPQGSASQTPWPHLSASFNS